MGREVGKQVLWCTLQGDGCKPAQCCAPEPTRQVRDVDTRRHSPAVAVVLDLGRNMGGQNVVRWSSTRGLCLILALEKSKLFLVYRASKREKGGGSSMIREIEVGTFRKHTSGR